MHGFSSGSGLLVNAEVDSMGGVVDGGGIFGTKSSPRRAAIKKAQAELKQEYDVREKRRRELEFLEKGGNPLDFKSVNTVSVSVQSTSLTNLQPEQLTSEVKGSFALTASPHGDSVESSGRPGRIPSVFEPNSGDNLMLFDGENDCLLPNKRNNNNNAVLSEQSEQLDGAQNVKESVDSATFALPKKAYRRRNRSRPNRDGAARSSSTVFPKSNGGILLKSVPADSPLDMDLDSVRAVESKGDPPDADSRILHDKEQGSEKASADVAIKEKHENQVLRGQMNGFVTVKGARKNISNESKIKENNDTELCTDLENIDSNGNVKEKSLVLEHTQNIEDNLVKEKSEILADDISGLTRTDQKNVSLHKTEDVPDKNSKSRAVDEAVGKEKSVTASETYLKESNLLDSNSTLQVEKPADSSVADLLESSTSVKESAVILEQQPLPRINLKLKSKTHEDSILEEARIIEAKRKRIAELSAGTLPSENHRKSQWDFVLEEMAWMANDFAQERLWKVSAACQISRRVAVASKLRFQEWNSHWKQKEVSQTVVKAVMDFWHKVEDKSKELDQQSPSKDFDLPVEGYAASFLKYNSFSAQHCSSQAPVPCDNISHIDIPDISWEEDHLTEENLFYTVAPGTMEAYRNSIENHLLQLGKTGSNIQDDVELSGYDAVAENTYEEDEGETSTYYLPGAFNGSKSSKFVQKKKKNFIKTNSARFYEAGADLSFMDNNNKFGKRPATSLNVSFPTKRVRTASRQRVISPFNIGPSGIIHAPNKTEASSGDTNSFQDDQSTMHSGFQIPNSLEVESTRNFEKQHPFDSTEVSNKPKKKKKTKHLTGSAYEHRWQLDSNFSNEQRDQLRKRTDNHQLESNGSTGLFGQNPSKKPKTMRQSLDNSMDIHNPMIGSSVPSPVGSSMSNIPNRNKFIKMISGRDRGRKNKALKMPSGQQGSGSPCWSLYEEQALVVLVHDMGPNWELVSDAMNSTLQFKCIYRKPKECCERHKELMDKNADGADSAEDSGTSQPYPSTLPGIPKGSARQLFQHLQGPMEEETLKSHFEKIIIIEQKQHSRKTRNDIQDPKQLQQPHSSHTLALSQVCPNNLSGGPVLTPLDLCDSTACSPESSMGYQGPGLPISNQATASSVLPPPATNSSALPPSPNPAAATNFSSPSTPLNAPSRDGRYGIPRTGSLPIDDQQRMQQYSQILSGRNIPQSGLPVSSGGSNERGVRLLPPGGNGIGMMGGLNRSMSMSRPGGFQSGIPSSSMLNSGSMLSSGGMSPMTNSVNIHPATGSNQGNSLLRPRDSMHMIRPHPEMQNNSPGAPSPSPFSGGLSPSFSNQAAQTLPPVQSYPLHHHQSHPMSPQQSLSHHPHLPNHAANTQNQAYAIRLAKERHLQQQQQRLLQHQQFTASAAAPNPLMQQPPQPQNNNGSNNSNTQASSPPVPLQPMTSSSPKHHMPINRNLSGGGSGSGSGNPTGKPRQRHPQQFQGGGPGRNHPQQRQQQPQSQQQQGKVLKSGGGIRPNNINSNITPADTSTLNNGPSSTKEGSHSSNQKVQTASSLKQSQPLVSQSDNPLQPPPQPHPKLLNRSQLTSQRLIQPNRQPLNSSQLVPSRIPLQVPKPESRGPTSQQSTDAQPPPPPPPPPPPQNDSSDTLLALQSGSTDTSPPETAAAPENPEPVGQGVVQRPPPGNSVTVSPEKPPVQQQPQQLAAPAAEESDQKIQILQAGNKNSLYVRPPNSGVE